MTTPPKVSNASLEDGKHHCTCGQFMRTAASPELRRVSNGGSFHQSAVMNSSMPLDASFVQVPSSFQVPEERLTNNLSASSSSKPQPPCSGFLRGLPRLEQAATDPSNPPPLCRSCVQRVEQALDADTARMRSECHTYKDSIREDEARIKGWLQAMNRAHSVGQRHGEEVLAGTSNDDHDVAQSTLEAYRNEIEVLEDACQHHRDELFKLRALQKEQAMLGMDLDRVHNALSEEQNALQLEARAFDNNQEQLSRALEEIQNEAERLSSSTEISLPSSLLHLQVDKERALRYPLINQLRLAYRPKGDIQRNEIQAAWSLASHLLLIVGTVFQFRSQHWKIVPLSHCAKLMYYPLSHQAKDSEEKLPATGIQDVSRTQKDRKLVVFNLGHSQTQGSKALLTWNALLCQIIQHATAKTRMACETGILDGSAVPKLPFKISPTTIGSIVLTQLDEKNDAEWSRAIHFMASDLLWLSKLASIFVMQQVLLASPLTHNVSEENMDESMNVENVNS